MPQYFFSVTADQEDHDLAGVLLHGEREAAEETLTIARDVLKASGGPL